MFSSMAIVTLVALGVSPYADASVSGGIERNASHGTSSAATVDAAYVGIEAWAGLAQGLWSNADADAEVGYSGSHYPELGELSYHAPGALLALRQRLGRSWRLRLDTGYSLRVQSDPARDGALGRAGASLAYELTEWLRVRAGVGVSKRWAEDDLYAYDAVRGRGALSARVGEHLALDLAYAVELTSSSYAMTVEAAAASGAQALEGSGSRAGGGAGGGVRAPRTQSARTDSTFGRDLYVYKDDSLAHTVTAELTYTPLEWLLTSLAAGWTLSTGDADDYTTMFAELRCGVRY